MLDALAGHEDALGVDRGDRRGLKTLLDVPLGDVD